MLCICQCVLCDGFKCMLMFQLEFRITANIRHVVTKKVNKWMLSLTKYDKSY